MAKLKSINNAGDLRSAIGRVFKAEEEGIRFKAVKGEKKGEKEFVFVGIFIGPMMPAFDKEKGALVNTHVYEGTVKPSSKDPKNRLVLLPKGAADPKTLKELTQACLVQSNLEHKIVVLKEGDTEPDDEVENESPEAEWKRRFDVLQPKLLAMLKSLDPKDERAKEISHQFFLAQQAIKDKDTTDHGRENDKDYGRALSLLGTVEKLVAQGSAPVIDQTKLRERYEKTREKVESMIEQLRKTKVPPTKTKQVETIYHQAIDLGKEGKYEDALSMLERAEKVEHAVLEGTLWEQKTNVTGYKKEKPLGSGAYGTTWLLGKLEVGSPPLVLKVGNNEKGKESLKHEEEFYQKLGNHPNIARCLGMRTVDGEEGLVLEAIKGGDMRKSIDTLRERLNKGELKHEEYWGAMQFSLARTLEVLDYMQSLGYAHVDLKPDNIMFDSEGEIKLIDMGLAAREGEGHHGTPGYMGPEVLAGPLGHKGDVFGAGAIAYDVGEGDFFRYHLPESDDPGEMIENFAQGKADAIVLDPKDELPNERDPDTGKIKRMTGVQRGETEYVKFVNWLMNRDPTKRPTAREALNHPFIKHRLLDDGKAKEVIKSVSGKAGTKSLDDLPGSKPKKEETTRPQSM